MVGIVLTVLCEETSPILLLNEKLRDSLIKPCIHEFVAGEEEEMTVGCNRLRFLNIIVFVGLECDRSNERLCESFVDTSMSA